MSRVTERFRHEARVVFMTPPGFNALNLFSLTLWVVLTCVTKQPGFLSGIAIALVAFVWGQHRQVKLIRERARTAVLWAQVEARIQARQEVLRRMMEEEI